MNSLLLIAGSLCDERVWAPQREALGINHEVLCPGPPVGFDTLEDVARAVLSNAPARFAIAGHALGARIALEIIRLEPDRVDRLALISASVAPVAEYEPSKRQEFIDLAHRQGMEELANHWIPQLVHPSHLQDKPLITCLMEMAKTYTPAQYEQESRMLMRRMDQSPILSTIKCNTLVIAGAQDTLSTEERNRAIVRTIGRGEVQFIDKCGHIPSLEQPEILNALLKNWLT